MVEEHREFKVKSRRSIEHIGCILERSEWKERTWRNPRGGTLSSAKLRCYQLDHRGQVRPQGSGRRAVVHVRDAMSNRTQLMAERIILGRSKFQ
jgi:hypothetical protein